MQPGGGRSRRRRSLVGASAKPHSLLSFSVTHRGAALGRRGGTRRPNLCPLENVKNGVKYFVFLADGLVLAFGPAGWECQTFSPATFLRLISFMKHLSEDADLFICSLSPLCSVYLQLASELTLLLPPARQTFLPGLIQVSAFLLSMDFFFIMHQRRGYSAPH